jgi:hypothetical protein
MLNKTSHDWVTDSCHLTSGGIVVYQHCDCSAHRILLADGAELLSEITA